jgi:hypothetical protein
MKVTTISLVAIGCTLATMAFAAPKPPPTPPTPKADLVLVTYNALYQGGAPISSSGGVNVMALGTYTSFDACSKAAGSVKIGFWAKGSSNADFASNKSLNWSVMCVERSP